MQIKTKKPLKRPNFQRGDRVEVEWADHWGNSSWKTYNKADEATPVICTSIGYFQAFSQCGDLVLASTMDIEGDGDQINGVHYRLWSTVTKIRKLK